MNYSTTIFGLAAAILLASCGGSDNKKPPKSNTSPIATATSFTTQADTAYAGTLNGTDADNDKLTFDAGTAPANGTLTLNKNGTYSYLPNAEFTGSDKFTFKVSDAMSSSAPVDVTITVDLLEVTFSDYSRKAFKRAATDNPLPLNSRKVSQDVTAANAYDDLLMQ